MRVGGNISRCDGRAGTKDLTVKTYLEGLKSEGLSMHLMRTPRSLAQIG